MGVKSTWKRRYCRIDDRKGTFCVHKTSDISTSPVLSLDLRLIVRIEHKEAKKADRLHNNTFSEIFNTWLSRQKTEERCLSPTVSVPNAVLDGISRSKQLLECFML